MLMQQTNEHQKPPLMHSYSLKVTSPRAKQTSQVSSFHPNRKTSTQVASSSLPLRANTLGRGKKNGMTAPPKERKEDKEIAEGTDDQLMLPISSFNPQRKEKSSPLMLSKPKIPVQSSPMQRRNSFADILRSVTKEIECEESFTRVSSNIPIQIPARFDTTNYMGDELATSLTTSAAPS